MKWVTLDRSSVKIIINEKMAILVPLEGKKTKIFKLKPKKVRKLMDEELFIGKSYKEIKKILSKSSL